MSMNKIIITSPCGTKEWQGRSANVPRIGESVTCRGGRALDEQFGGIVEDVHYEVRKGFGVNEHASHDGMIISIWLKEG